MKFKPKRLTLRDAERILKETRETGPPPLHKAQRLKPVDPETAGPLLLRWLARAGRAYQVTTEGNYSAKAFRKNLKAIHEHARELPRLLASDLHTYSRVVAALGKKKVTALVSLCGDTADVAEAMQAGAAERWPELPLDYGKPRARNFVMGVVVLAAAYSEIFGRQPKYSENRSYGGEGPFAQFLLECLKALKIEQASEGTARQAVKLWGRNAHNIDFSQFDTPTE